MVDTSSWVQVLRRSGDPTVRARVGRLVDDHRAAWCEMVRLERWAGVGNAAEREALERLDDALPRVPITDDVWTDASRYGSEARMNGRQFPAADLLIFACARRHVLPVERNDGHYDVLEQLFPYDLPAD
jgi:predicted nucleic acid-binding protein